MSHNFQKCFICIPLRVRTNKATNWSQMGLRSVTSTSHVCNKQVIRPFMIFKWLFWLESGECRLVNSSCGLIMANTLVNFNEVNYRWFINRREGKQSPRHKRVSFCALGSPEALPDVLLKPDSYGFRSMKMVYGQNLSCTPKSYCFLVINVNCLILINERKI